jgi:hypothetical protein
MTEEKSQRNWGCSVADYLSLRCKPMRGFQQHRKNARQRGIGWELSLWQWWTIWQESGHWDHRGSGQGYVMCREGDIGPYTVGNVFIAPGIVNCSDKAAKRANLPIGVTYTKHGRYRATRMFDGKRNRLGVYEVPELAHAAYLSLGPIGCQEIPCEGKSALQFSAKSL